MIDSRKGFKTFLFLSVIALGIIGGSVYFYKNQRPDLIVENVIFLQSGMTVTIKNVGKKDTVGKIYLCTTDVGDEKYKQSTSDNFACGTVSLVSRESKEVEGFVPIKAGESVDTWQQTDHYGYPLYIAIDKANEAELNNRVKESNETNNLYIIKSQKEAKYKIVQ